MKDIALEAGLRFWLAASTAALAGPPFQTDDPEPIDYKNYEFYTFASSDGTPVETDTEGPALEFNWGAAAESSPAHHRARRGDFSGRRAARAFGIGDIELGIKYRFVQEGKHRPMIGTFTMFEIPTGSAPSGLGVGKTWYKVPLWAQKSFGPWTTYGGGGATVFSVPGLSQLSVRGLAGAARFRQEVDAGQRSFLSRAGRAAGAANAPVDAGGLRRLLQISRSGVSTAVLLRPHIVGQTENYAYLGLYWTWGKKEDKDHDKDNDRPENKPAGAAFNLTRPPGML